MRNYMKKRENTVVKGIASAFADILIYTMSHKKMLCAIVVLFMLIPAISFFAIHKNVQESQSDEFGLVSMADIPIAASSSGKSVITIPKGIVKANPFVPYRDITGTSVVPDVPVFNIVEPPEVINENSDAARVMDTIVSGILYDKFSPSAILNIEGNDYLVKKGDVVNNYKIVSIAQDSVTVQLGNNVYKAGIGEILTEGSLNRNNESNLNNKFGGVK